MLLTSRRKSANVTSEAVKIHSKSMSNFKKISEILYSSYCTNIYNYTYRQITNYKTVKNKDLKKIIM